MNRLAAELSAELERAYKSKAGVTPERIQYFHDRQQELCLPDAFIGTFYERTERLEFLTRLRKAPELPRISVRRIMDTDEYAHYEGTLLLTNKKFQFVADRGPGSQKVLYNNVSQVRQTDETTILLQVEQGGGGGCYDVADAEVIALLIHQASRRWKGHLVSLKEQSNTLNVPEHIKVAVRQRDRGQCRMCGYADPYIEFDHILPRSKGGPNTIDNIQLLCRGCNRKKSDKLFL
jgi:HNH endonuclease